MSIIIKIRNLWIKELRREIKMYIDKKVRGGQLQKTIQRWPVELDLSGRCLPKKLSREQEEYNARWR